jgi:hypothetical protein
VGDRGFGGSQFNAILGKKVRETPFQTISQAWWYVVVIPAI